MDTDGFSRCVRVSFFAGRHGNSFVAEEFAKNEILNDPTLEQTG
jgi:hypothetical protein